MPLENTQLQNLENYYQEALERNDPSVILQYLDSLLSSAHRDELYIALNSLYKKFKEHVSSNRNSINRALIEYSLKHDIKKSTYQDISAALFSKISQESSLASEYKKLIKGLSIKNKFILLYQSIESKNEEDVQELFAVVIQQESEASLMSIINYTDNQHDTLLIQACLCKCVSIAKSLIKAGANVNLPSQKLDKIMVKRQNVITDILSPAGLYPLHAASYVKNLTLVRLLLENGALVRQQTSELATALHIACLENSTEIAGELLRYGPIDDIFKGNILNHTPLMAAMAMAIKTKDDSLLFALLDKLNAVEKNKYKENITSCIQHFSTRLEKGIRAGESFFINLNEKLLVFQNFSLHEEKDRNTKKKRKKKYPLLQEEKDEPLCKEENSHVITIQEQKTHLEQNSQQAEPQAGSIAQKDEIKKENITDAKVEPQQEIIGVSVDVVLSSTENKLSKNKYKEFKSLRYKIKQLSISVGASKTESELEEVLQRWVEYKEKSNQFPQFTLSSELENIESLLLKKRLLLNSTTIQTKDLINSHEEITSNESRAGISADSTDSSALSNTASAQPEVSSLSTVSPDEIEESSSSLENETPENLMDFYEPDIEPACLKNAFWRQAFSILVRLVRALPEAQKILLFGSANYKFNPKDFDLAFLGLEEYEWNKWKNLIEESKVNSDKLKELPLSQLIERMSGKIEFAYNKPEYNALIIKATFTIKNKKISYDFSILPPKMCLKEHASKLDVSVGAMYFDPRTKQMFCPIPGTMQHLKRRLLWAISNPYNMFRADPSIILRFIRTIASTRDKNNKEIFRLSDLILKAIGDVLKENPYLLNMQIERRTVFQAADKHYHEMTLLFEPGYAVKTLQVLQDYNLLQYFFTPLLDASVEVYHQTLSLMREVAILFDRSTKSQYIAETKATLFYQQVPGLNGENIDRPLYPSLMYYASLYYLYTLASDYITIRREPFIYQCTIEERMQVNIAILGELAYNLYCKEQQAWKKNERKVSSTDYTGSFHSAPSLQTNQPVTICETYSYSA